MGAGTIPFGKHKGKTLEAILDEDPGWLLWFSKQDGDGWIKNWCLENIDEIEIAAKDQKKDKKFSPSTSTKNYTSNATTPEINNIYYKMFSTAFCLLNPGQQIACKNYWKDKGVIIEGVREEDLKVTIK